MSGNGKIQSPDANQGDVAGVDADEKDGPVRALRAGVPALPGEEKAGDEHPARLPEDVEDRFTVR